MDIPVIHKKTGKEYIVLHGEVTECTNGREELKYVVYVNTYGQIFCREKEEFWRKFEVMDVLAKN